MNRNALNLALALGLAAGAPALAEDGGEAGTPTHGTAPAAVEDCLHHPSWADAALEGTSSRLADEGAGTEVVVKGRPSYSERRALGDARIQLERVVAEWLAPEVPDGWAPPAPMLDGLVVDRHVDAVAVDPEALGLAGRLAEDLPDRLHVAALKVDLGLGRRAALIAEYDRAVGSERLTLLGGLAGFVLACLAIFVTYVRADEATKGYFTNRLRVLALGAAGAAGYAVYRFLV